MNAIKILQQGLHDFWVRHSLPKEVGVLIALSGGGDSVALLHLLLQLAPFFSLRIQAAHLDHGIRAESGRDVDFVQQLCSEWQVPLTVERLDLPKLARERGQGLEEAGHELRREFLQRTADALGCDYIALGHHRGDQAETLLMRLVRGSGLTGLAAMRPLNDRLIRPLLTFSRKQVEDYLEAIGQAYLQDASNEDLYYTRNRIRHRVLPELTELNPRLGENLVALTQRISSEEDFWQQEVKETLGAVRTMDDRGLWLNRPALLDLHPALRARVLRQALQEVRGDLRGIGAIHVEAMEKLLEGTKPQAEAHLPGAWAGRRYERLWLRPIPPIMAAPFTIEVRGPGEVLLPDGRRMVFSIEAAPQGETPVVVEFPAQLVPFPLTVRSFRPGDRFHPDGAPGSRKLKKFFIDAKIDRETRAAVPLLEGRQILWLAGLARCQQWACVEGEGPVLRVVVQAC
ncbi:tRNA lysidine(34) synthetase TilS [Syntrophotalea acetylenivorans]|uniref:tRNA(Ile)-lysidine synthase n=1 Tax=Syntrophotalea acetylenivorans TaxID=1842532 RepID=A0A1L3GNI3_9BACT|nr:tRNA lysidine(34) synthetase TilS [Syntrophotalea acetylenivorans]APG27445.1 tRNA lysidine(34) synthetase TilS [Syntrophotalea acetylenivorans]